MNYFYSYYSAGCTLDSLLESKLIDIEEYSRSSGRVALTHLHRVYHQFYHNLTFVCDNRKTEFFGDFFNEQEALLDLDDNKRNVVLFDVCIFRLILGFIFWDEDCMAEMLTKLDGMPFTFDDVSTARTHLRLAF